MNLEPGRVFPAPSLTRVYPRTESEILVQALTYVMALGNTLYSTALRLESKSRQTGSGEGAGAQERSVSIETGAREAIAQLDHSGRMVLACRWVVIV
jgi:hypothetical protein